jgi:hypothetical protein
MVCGDPFFYNEITHPIAETWEMLGGYMKVYDDTQEAVVESQVKLNLQLFANDDEDLSDDGWGEYADDESKEDSADDSESLDKGNDEDESGKNPEFANLDKSKAKQNKDENAIYASMRRKAEAEERAKIAREREELDIARRQFEEEKRINSITQEKVWQKADDEGISEEAARKLLILEEKERLFQEREKRISREAEIREQKKRLKGEKYFAELEDEIDKMLSTHSDVNVEGAFHYLRSVKLDDLLTGKLKAQEQRTIANMHDKAKRGSISSDASDTHTVKSTGLTRKLSEVWGFNDNDVQDIQKHVSRRSKELKK